MNGRSLLMLLLAVGLGLGAMYATRQFLSRPGPPVEATQEILVAARDVKEEEVLKPDMVKAMRLPVSAIPVGAFAAFKEIEDRWVRTALLEGDPVVEKRLGPKGTPPGLVANIPKGMRAFAVEVNEQSGVSGFILPHHRVDVVRFDSNERGPGAKAETILQNVEVLATGQVFTRAEEKTVQSRTVTLALTPDQVDTLVAAKAKGPLSLSLRGVNDHEVVQRPPPKPVPDDETKTQLARLQKELADQRASYTKLEEAHGKLAEAHGKLEQAHAKKLAEPPPPPPPPKPAMQRWVHIYRPLHVRRDDDRKRGEYPERVAVNEAARLIAARDKQSQAQVVPGPSPAGPAVTRIDHELPTEAEETRPDD
ncbi:MAG: Flp pilus assembly protein CpaB [Isosphaeraceae bacterium]